MEPTQEQIKEFWEWCGIKEIISKALWRYERYKETNHWWGAPNGRKYKELPPLDLNNLFEYAVPKLKQLFPAGTIPKALLSWVETKDDTALALFWAIWEVNHKHKGEDKGKDRTWCKDNRNTQN